MQKYMRALARSPKLSLKSRDGAELYPQSFRGARSCVAIFKYIARDRPDVSRTLSQPRDGTEVGVKRVLRHARMCPSAALRFESSGERGTVRVWTDRELTGDADSGWSCINTWVELEGTHVFARSELPSDPVLFPGKRLEFSFMGIAGPGQVEINLSTMQVNV